MNPIITTHLAHLDEKIKNSDRFMTEHNKKRECDICKYFEFRNFDILKAKKEGFLTALTLVGQMLDEAMKDDVSSLKAVLKLQKELKQAVTIA